MLVKKYSTRPLKPSVSTFVCGIGCITTPLNGNPQQASFEATFGSGFEICFVNSGKNKSDTKPCEDNNKKNKDCGMYDPNCDNNWEYPDIPLPDEAGGYFVGASMKRDGSLCIKLGVFAGLPLPSFQLGDLYE